MYWKTRPRISQAITWSGSGTGTLVGSADGRTIVTATIDNTGNYTVTLVGPIDHAAGAPPSLAATAGTPAR